MKRVMSFEDFCKSKSKHWKLLVSKGTERNTKNLLQESNVSIIISFYEWHKEKERLKPKRGKIIALAVSSTDPYTHLLEKAVMKWHDFHSDCFYKEEECTLLLENRKEALFLPGSKKEFFSLKRYRE